MLGMSKKSSWIIFPAAAETSLTCSNWKKKTPSLFSVISMGTPCEVILVLQVPIYSVCSRIGFVVSILPANFLASSSFSSRMSHIVLDILTKIFGLLFGSSLMSPADTNELTCYHIGRQQRKSPCSYSVKDLWDGEKLIAICAWSILLPQHTLLASFFVRGLSDIAGGADVDCCGGGSTIVEGFSFQHTQEKWTICG